MMKQVLGSSSTQQRNVTPPAWDALLRRLIDLPLLLPSVLWVVGLHRRCLAWGIVPLGCRRVGILATNLIATYVYWKRARGFFMDK